MNRPEEDQDAPLDPSEAFSSSSPYFGSMVSPVAKIVKAETATTERQPPMTAPTTTIASELSRLQSKIDAGKLDPNTPAFVLLGTDVLAAGAVTVWAASGRAIGVPEERVGRAMAVAEEMRKWRKEGSGVPGNREKKM